MDEELKKLFDEYPAVASVLSLYFGLRVMRIVLDTLSKEVLQNEIQ